MFQFPGYASSYPIFSGSGDRMFTPTGFPHSDITRSAYLQLPDAFRRLLRPSSAPSA